MAILRTRVVISQGAGLQENGAVHLEDASESPRERRINEFPDIGAPIQQMWWTPLANLGGFDKFKSIGLKRPNGVGNWHLPKVVVRSSVPSPGKVAIALYVQAAEVIEHAASVNLGNTDAFKLHKNTATATLTFPPADASAIGLEYYFEASDAANVMTIAVAGGSSGTDRIVRGGNSSRSAVSTAADARMILSCKASGFWTIERFNKDAWDLP